MHMRRFLKYGIAVALTGGGATYLQHKQWDPSAIGAIRFGRAASAVVRVAVDYKTSLYGLDPHSQEYNERIKKVHLSAAERLCIMCSANGGVFIKVGQHIGALEYLLPKEYVDTFKVFYCNAPESSLNDVYEVIHSELKQKVNELFCEFDEKPLGTASLAQVHKARIRESGEVVAVKVQHKRVKAHSFVDTKSMELLVNMIAWLFPEFSFMWLVNEMRRNLPRELDFIYEGRNAERVSRMFSHFAFLKVPHIHWKYTTNRVLTMDFCEGGKVDDLSYMKNHNISVHEVTGNLGKLYSEMIFVHGYVHCDPHPGNVLVQKTASHGVQLTLLDHGLYTTLTDDFRLNYANLWLSLIWADMKGIEKYSQNLGIGRLYPLLACILTARSWESVTSGIGRTTISPKENNLIKERAAQYIVEITKLLSAVPQEMILIFKTNDLLRGIEYALQTHQKTTSFINMSKCCVQAVYNERLRLCGNNLPCKLKTALSRNWVIFQITIYELYLFLQSWMSGVWCSLNKT